MCKLIESKFGGYEAIPGGREGEMSHFVTLWWPSVSGYRGPSGAHTAHLHWTLETLDTPDTDNTQPAAKLIDDTQNINYYEAFLYRA